METILIRTLQLVLSLSILVIAHEFGHFLFARMFKIRVEKFYLFFNPWFSLFKFKPKNSDTEYGIGWLPLGGYVKIAGMIDESMDKEQMAQPEQEWEFRSKPAWQRLLVMVGGVVFNFILALLIYAGILFISGDTYIPLHNATMGMDFSETAHRAGFRDGDILWSADGIDFDRFNEKTLQMVVEASSVTVKRNGEMVNIPIPQEFMQQFLRDKKGFASMRIPMIVDEPQTPSAKASGLQKGDRIIGINSQLTPTDIDVRSELSKYASTAITLTILRNGAEQNITAEIDENGKLGITTLQPIHIFEAYTQTFSLITALPAGINKAIDKLNSYVGSMKYVFTKEGATSIGGFGTIAKLFLPYLDWEFFWGTTAFLSIMLAFMNILPIPALDGGHVLFLLVEVITRKKPNEKFLEYAQLGGMLLLFALLIYANGNDLIRFLFP